MTAVAIVVGALIASVLILLWCIDSILKRLEIENRSRDEDIPSDRIEE